MRLDLGGLGLDAGGDILVARALRQAGEGEAVEIAGSHAELAMQLRAWARMHGHGFALAGDGRGCAGVLTCRDRAAATGRAGSAGPGGAEAEALPWWGLAARGAEVELGGPRFDFSLIEKDEIWSDDAVRLYARAAASQWDPASAIDWDAPIGHDEEIEEAVVQVMTYLIENETAALIVPARFLARLHPHFREIMQLLAQQAAEEARHIEVFTRRALMRRETLGLSTTGGQASLKTLLDEPDFALASFLLSVMGEGSFLVLLDFLAKEGPDPVTRQVCRLAAQDEARHVAFGLAHLQRHAGRDPGLLPRLARAMERRHAALADTAGLNALVFEALAVIAAGAFTPEAIGRGYGRILQLQDDMDRARRTSLVRLGFPEDEARALSQLHTRNFM